MSATVVIGLLRLIDRLRRVSVSDGVLDTLGLLLVLVILLVLL